MINLASKESRARSHLTRWTNPALFAITFCTLFGFHMQLSGLAQRLDLKQDVSSEQQLASRVSALEEASSTHSTLPPGVSYSDLNALNDSFNERVGELATAMTVVASRADLELLLERVQRIEKNETQRAVDAVAKKTRPTLSRRKKAIEFPLQILGQELRSGERFLSVGTLGEPSVDQCRLMRIGETHLGWKLESIDTDSAVFATEGNTHRLSIR